MTTGGPDVSLASAWSTSSRLLGHPQFVALKLFQCSVVQTTWLFLWLIDSDIFVEPVTDTLTKSIDSATGITWLVSNSLEVLFGVECLGVGGQFHSSALGWHMSVLLTGVLANVCGIGVWHIVVVDQTTSGIWAFLISSHTTVQDWIGQLLLSTYILKSS